MAGTSEAITVLSDDWWVIPLVDADQRKRSIGSFLAKSNAELGETAASSVTSNPPQPGDLTESLETGLALAAEKGARVFAAFQDRENPLPLTLLVFREPGSLDAVRVRLQMQAHTGGDEAQVAAGDTGPVLRTITTSDNEQTIQYWLDPGDGHGVYHALFTLLAHELPQPLVAACDEIISMVHAWD